MAPIQVRLIFANYDGKPEEVTIPIEWSFKELKRYILTEKWPLNFMDVSAVDRLRLFSSGRELDETRTVNDLSNLASQAGFAPVHVTVVTKAAREAASEAARDHAKQSVGCQCILM